MAAEPMYYYASLSSRAATIVCRRKQDVDQTWGRLAGVPSGSGRWVIGLFETVDTLLSRTQAVFLHPRKSLAESSSWLGPKGGPNLPDPEGTPANLAHIAASRKRACE